MGSVNLTKMMVGVAVGSEGQASWASTKASRLSCLMGIGHHEGKDDQHGHRPVWEARPSPSRMPMRSEQALRASWAVPLIQ